MTREQLEAHLQFYTDLGVEGYRREAEWRSRIVADTPVVGDALAVADSPAVADTLVERDLPPPDAPVVLMAPLGQTSGGRGPAVAPVTIATPVSPVASYTGAAGALNAVRVDIGPDCSRCKLHTLGRRQVVFGVGNPEADLMFVGEAPGADEDLQGEPFVGKAGQLLTKIIEAIGLTREQVYIANVIKCRPPGNRNPEPDEVEQCEPFLFRQIDIIKPKVIVALGKFAAQSLLRTADPITRIRGREYTYRDAILMPTYHPAFLLRNPSAKREVWEDMKRVREILRGGE